MDARALGRHLLLDLYDADPALLDDPERLPGICLEAVRASGGTALDVRLHRFEPHGVTVVVMVSESHLAIHTWPEHGYAGVDYFTCGDRVDPHAAADVLLRRLAPGHHHLQVVPRGEAHARGPRPARGD
jgi:S-adenosylmethionine decarboxylase